MARRSTALPPSAPEHRVDSVMNHGRMGTHRKTHNKSVIADAISQCDVGTVYASFSHIQAQSTQIQMPPVYAELTERLSQQALQLEHLFDQKTAGRKRVVAHCIVQMQETRDALPGIMQQYVQARIEALNPLTAGDHEVRQTEEDARIALRDAINNAKLRLPIAHRMKEPTSQIVMAISDAVDALVQETLTRLQRPAVGHTC